MDEVTVRRLNEINREFYRVTAEAFSETRSRPWPGWNVLFPYLMPLARRGGFSVLDAGCGNGRFGVFLAEHLDYTTIAYHGFDNNPTLLKHAEEALESLPNVTATLEQRDVILAPPDAGEYDLVVMFGLIHHIPGYDHRQAFLRQMAGRVQSGGLLVFACWRFYEYPRFQQRILPWPDDLAGQVERHDYLLDWRRGETEPGAYAQRYCHYVDNAEHADLSTATGLRELHTFRADGFTNDVNRYSVLQRHGIL